MVPQALTETGETVFVSSSLIDVSPPSFTDPRTLDVDRYIAGELAVLDGAELASQVATAIGDDNPETVRRSVSAEQQIDTNIVVITATTRNADRSQLIAQTYADLFVSNQIDLAEAAQAPAISRLNVRLDEIANDLTALSARITSAMTPLIDEAALQGNAIPQLEIVDPEASTLLLLLQQEYSQIVVAKNDLELVATASANSEIVQAANLPTQPIIESENLVIIGGLVVGAMFGVALAVLWARFSSSILDARAAAEIMGEPLAGSLVMTRIGPSTVHDVLTYPEADLEVALDGLAARAEGRGTLGEPLVVAVVATSRGAGATTLSVALAGRFADAGAGVVIVDTDGRNAELTRLFRADGYAGIPALTRDPNIDPDEVFAPTTQHDVEILGLGRRRDNTALRRAAVPVAIDAARRRAPVVIVDAGPMLDAASAAEACSIADAVVVAVPVPSENVRTLGDVARELSDSKEKLLPVATRFRSALGRLRGAVLRGLRIEQRRRPRVDNSEGDDYIPLRTATPSKAPTRRSTPSARWVRRGQASMSEELDDDGSDSSDGFAAGG